MMTKDRYEKLKLRQDIIEDVIAKNLSLEKLRRLKAIILEGDK